MKGRIFTLVIVLCIILVSCTTNIDAHNMQAPSPTEVTPRSTIDPKVLITPVPTPTHKTPISESTPKPTATPIPESILNQSLPDLDTSYVDDTIRPSYLVFDDTYMYYIDGKVIKKRHVETGEENTIFDGVYDNCYLSLQDEWLYLYTKGKGIIKVKIDGTKMEVVRNIQARKVMVVEDKLYFLFNYYPWLMGDSLYEYDIVKDEMRKIYDFVWNMLYKDNVLYFCEATSELSIFCYYDLKTKKCIPRIFHHDWYLPYVENHTAYYFGEVYSDEPMKFIKYNLNTKQETMIDYIDGSDVYPFYNYLVYLFFVNENIYLGAYDMKTEKTYPLIKREGGYIYDMVEHNNALYIVSNDNENQLHTKKPNCIVKLTIEDGKSSIKSVCKTEANNNYKIVEPMFKKLSDLPINKNWGDVEIVKDWHSTIYNDKRLYIDNDTEYEFLINDHAHIYIDDEKGEGSMLIPNIYTSEEFAYCLYEDTLYYFKETQPILCSYNIKTGKTREYDEIMAYPFQTKQYYQCLIFDSFYNGYDYCEYSNEEDIIYTGQCIAFNMETGEITQIECEYPN